MSAQQARDRKKVYVTELEERIAQLEEEVCFLLDSRDQLASSLVSFDSDFRIILFITLFFHIV